MRPIPGQHGETLHAPKNVSDITDSERDQERLRPDETTIDLPDVEDIPGQENITVQPLGALADTTISSDDEEGIGLLDKDETYDSDVTPEEIEALRRSADVYPSRDEEMLQSAGLDETDAEGDLLNEASLGNAASGSDLDLPGSEGADDPDVEALGQGDEENSFYSLNDNEDAAENS